MLREEKIFRCRNRYKKVLRNAIVSFHNRDAFKLLFV